MLGYVNIHKGELKVREYEVYCGYYCGVCKSIGKRYGQLPRMALSYDAAFLAILLASLDEASDIPVREHCIGHRIKKKTIIRNEAVDYAADVMLILAWHKLLDDAEDEGKIYAKAASLLLRGIYKKLQRRYPRLCQSIEGYLKELSALEDEKCSLLDMSAESFSKIMEVIFSEGFKRLYGKNTGAEAGADAEAFSAHENAGFDIEEPDCEHKIFLRIDTMEQGSEAGGEALSTEKKLAAIGYHMGKWIYMMDAADDIEDNIRTGAYNPLLYRFEYDPAVENADGFRLRIEENLRFNLYQYLAVISNCLNTLDIKKNKGIIENIIYFGLNRRTEEVITGKEQGESNEPL